MVKFTGKNQDFEQKIESIQEEHKMISTAKKGMVIGVKVDIQVKTGDQLFLAS